MTSIKTAPTFNPACYTASSATTTVIPQLELELSFDEAIEAAR